MTYKTILAASLAAIFAISMMANNVYAANPLHVTSGTVAGGNIVLTTDGQAGVAVPDEPDTIFAYVAVTDNGIFAATSHFGSDNPPVNSPPLVWHTHKVTLDSNGCVTSLTTVGAVTFSGNNVVISGTGATSVTGALGAMLKISDAGVCVKKVF